MANRFDIPENASTITLIDGVGTFTFTVHNTGDQPMRARARIVPQGETPEAWFTIDGETEGDFAGNSTKKYVVKIVVPPGETGSHRFQLHMIGVDDPDEEFSESSEITFTIPVIQAVRKKYPLWIIPVVLGAMVIVWLGYITFDNYLRPYRLLNRDNDSEMTWDQKAPPRGGLRFENENQWVDLQAFDTESDNFTVEMWVDPLTKDDGQSFIGKYDEFGNNVFRIGYWDGGLKVSVGDDSLQLLEEKRSTMHHLAVVVEAGSPFTDTPASGSVLTVTVPTTVTVFIDGEAKESDILTNTVVLTDGLTLGEISELHALQYFRGKSDAKGPWILGQDWSKKIGSWVLGQDWDNVNNEPNESDFFSGAITDVRIWRTVRAETDIRNFKDLRLRGKSLSFLGAVPGVGKPWTQDGNLAAYWPLDTETVSGARAINKTRGKDGTLYPRADPPQAVQDIGLNPSYDTALLFDGYDDSVAITITSPISTPVTLSAWIFLPGIPSEAAGLIELANVAALSINEDGFMTLSNGSKDLPDGIPVPANTWVHYAGTVSEDGALNLYRNGGLVADDNRSSSTGSTGFTSSTRSERSSATTCPGLCIGKFDDGGYFGGKIDEVQIWNSRLGEDEIFTQMRIAGTLPDENAINERNSLIGYWSFDENRGPTSKNLKRSVGMDAHLDGPIWVDSDIVLEEASGQ